MPASEAPKAMQAAGNAQARTQDEARRIPSGHLLGAARQAVIVHRGREYRLHETQNGRLILTA